MYLPPESREANWAGVACHELNLVAKGGMDLIMTDFPCDYPECLLLAKEKCSSCGKIFCIKHIQLISTGYTCDLCVQKSTEKEMFRWQLKKAYIGERQESLKQPSCIITTKRILLNASSSSYQLQLSAIQSVKPQFLFELLGIHYWAAIYTGGYTLNDWGNIHLYTNNKQERETLISHIKQALMQLNG